MGSFGEVEQHWGVKTAQTCTRTERRPAWLAHRDAVHEGDPKTKTQRPLTNVGGEKGEVGAQGHWGQKETIGRGSEGW